MNISRIIGFVALFVGLGAYAVVSHSDEVKESESDQIWEPIFTEFTRVQSGDWLDDNVFAVGRWDGTISLFRKPVSGEFTPVLLDVISTSNGGGVEMLVAAENGALIYSDTESQLGVWDSRGDSVPRFFEYDKKIGVANVAIFISDDTSTSLVTGHANGYIAVWNYSSNQLQYKSSYDISSNNPIDSPYPLKNIRGLALWKGSQVVAGSEDGDISIIDINTGKTNARMRYNQYAQRGINNISLVGDTLLLANCSVGKDDDNLWLYDLSGGDIKLIDSLNLIRDKSRPQSFNFDADLVSDGENLQFYASTEEGILWAGNVMGNLLVVDRAANIASDGGALIDVSDNKRSLLAAARKLFLFDL